MQLRLDKTFDDYISVGEESARELLAANGPLIQALRINHDYFAKTLWADGPDIQPVPAILALNAFMLFLAGTRIAMTSHAAAIFPTLRTALEYACYAFLITDNPSLGDVWAKRHESATSLKASRSAFTGSVRLTAQRLNDIQAGSGEWILDAYDSAIDYGAHPNPRGVFGHVSLIENATDTHHEVNIGGLYGSQHFETERSLIGCLDFGLAIAVVLTRCRKEFSDQVQAKLNELNEQKERIVAELNARNAA